MDERTERLVELAELLNNWLETLGGDDEAERAICRAAAEITGLRTSVAVDAEYALDRYGFHDDGTARSVLRRFAELASPK